MEIKLIVKRILSASLILTSILAAASSYSAQAKDDSSLKESSLCNRYFSIYENKHHMPSNMLRAISVTESGKWINPIAKSIAWPWTINVGGKGYHYDSKIEAIQAVKKLMKKGRSSIDVGCMQINLKYHPEAFNNLEQAFEPKYNIEYAAEFLAKKYKQKRSWEAAIRHYHNANPIYSNKYIARVYKTWRIEDQAVNVALLDTPAMNITVRQRPDLNQSNDVSEITKSVLGYFVR